MFRNLPALLMCAAGIVLNLICRWAVGRMGVPLYLDTVGTVCAGVLGGPLPAVIVGFFTNIFKSFSDTSALYYGIVNVLIALAASVIARGSTFDIKHPKTLLKAVLVFTLIGGGIGTLIPWFLDGIKLDSSSLAASIYDAGLRNEAVAQMLSALISDLPDKAITVLLAVLIVLLLPAKLRQRVRFSGWMQTPLPREESEAVQKGVPCHVPSDKDSACDPRLASCGSRRRPPLFRA